MSPYVRPAISGARRSCYPSIRCNRQHIASSHLIRSKRSISTTATRSSGNEGHESHYDPPGGWLWAEPPGHKYEKEGWENIWYWGFYGGLGVFVVAYAFKPDTGIETWALEEAKRRLQAEGTLPEDD